MSRNDSSKRRLIAPLVVACVLLAASAPVGAGSVAPPADTVAVAQGGECWEVQSFGDGSDTVESFYDYRAPNTTPSGDEWGSYGTRSIQRNQGSVLAFHQGPNGTSLVVVHDAIGGAHGGTVTFDFLGLPERGNWTVEDDPYPDREDNFDYFANGTEADIDWKWSAERVDGAAFTGIGATNGSWIRVNPGFNERADKWESWSYAQGENRTEGWYLHSADGGVQELSMNRQVRIRTGGCPDGVSPMATLSTSSARNGTAMAFDVEASYANGSVTAYEWDWDGDDVAEQRTTSGSVVHEFEETGLRSVTVTAFAADGSTTSVSELVVVNRSLLASTDVSTPTSTATATPPTTTASGTVVADPTTADPTTETTEDPGSGGSPGLGVVAALVGVGATMLLALARRRRR